MRNFIFVLFNIIIFSQVFAIDFYKGNDASFIDELEQKKTRFRYKGNITDPLFIYKNNGMNIIRLRIWNNPKSGYCNLQRTLIFAKRIKNSGFHILLDFHYSDSWADPGKQTIPLKWKNMNISKLNKAIYKYSKKVVLALKKQDTLPDIIQVGNEIDNGFLWPKGKLKNIKQFTSLLKSGIRGIEGALTKEEMQKTKIMLHISSGGNKNKCEWFYNQMLKYDVDFDLIGLSYYPWWHGDLIQLQNNLTNLSNKFDKDIIITETGYPWTLGWYDDKHNIVGNKKQLLTDMPATVEGQNKFILKVIKIVKDIPNKKGKGVIYWAGDYISVPQKKSPWENIALFDFYGNTLKSISAFK